VFDFDSEGDHDFLVMEFVPGGTLESRLREGPLPLVQIQSLGAEVADALEHAHRHGVLHRDLKPGNVALTPDGRPKILDFGLARLLSGDAVTGRLTQEGTVMGSLAYMAPEQLAGEEEDPRTDVYALGATLFELATGQRPFAQDRPQALMFAIVNTPAPSARSLRPDATADPSNRVSRLTRRPTRDSSRGHPSA
jgi:serine/threonine-protein kinase